MSDDVMGRAAMYLATLGVEVFPCRPREKTPAVARGFLTASADLATVAGWWKDMPAANVAIRPEGVVLDVDDRGPGTGPDALAALVAAHGPLPETWTASSGRGEGRHYHFTMPAGHPGVRGWVTPVPHLDIKSHATGYVVAPPSVHPSGSVYQWVAGHAPWECPLAEAPAWLVAMMRPVGEDAPTRGAAKSRPGARKASDDERSAFLRAVQAAAQGTTPAAREMRHILEGAVVAEPGSRDSTWTRLTYRLCTMVVSLDLGDALDDLVGGLVADSLEAEGRAAPGGATLESALDKCARALPRVEAEVARARTELAIIAEHIPSMRGESPGGLTEDEQRERISQVAPTALPLYDGVMRSPWECDGYPARTVTDLEGWAMRCAMTRAGWFVLCQDGAKETLVCHEWPEGEDSPSGPLARWTPRVVRSIIRTQVQGAEGKPESLVTQWMASAPVYTRTVLRERNDDEHAINLYRGLAVDPLEGDTAPWAELLAYVTDGKHTEWLEKWLAWKLQHPFLRPGSAIILEGGEGTGKSQLVERYSSFFGRHGLKTSMSTLLGRFTSFLEGKLLVRVDESGELSRAEVSRLKDLVTGDVVTIERKGENTFAVPSSLALLVTGNDDVLSQAAGEGRRWAIFRARDEALPAGWFGRFDGWWRGGGARAVAHRLLTMDLAEYDPTRRPVSDALRANRVSALRRGDAWLAALAGGLLLPPRKEGEGLGMLVGSGSAVLHDGGTYTMSELWDAYSAWCRSSGIRSPGTVEQLGVCMTKWGLEPLRSACVRKRKMSLDVLEQYLMKVQQEGKHTL